ncbi:hypothetical protein PV04_04558 [Phialophora macrospora]|uniref:FAD dependent oxidoreductase domain-containing protein n=1 Tax=Phialophora macrospora TaxID=1851006 RepID=A0A0D2G9L2_9EURO|nr:hypothetical protein PV04_04558 [Phialophora macrospora]
MGDAGTSATVPRSSPTPVQAGLPSVHPTASFWQTSHPNRFTHHRSTPELPTLADVVVIGTGISGTFAVDQLLNQLESSANVGSSLPNVLVLEARTLCSAATGRNGGHLQPVVHAAPASILDFEMKNFDHVSSIRESGNIQCDFRRLSGCLGFWNETYFEEAKRDLTLASAKHAELVRVVEDAEQLRGLGLKGGVKGAIVQTIAASLSPYKLCVGMWEGMLKRFETKAESSAGRETDSKGKAVTLNLQTTTAVTSLERPQEDDGVHRWRLNTPRGCVHARSVILATNGYTSHLLPEFAPLIRPVQAQMSALIPPSISPSNRGHDRRLIPMSYGFEGVGTMDRVMSDYLVQNPFVSRTISEQQTDAASDNVNEGGHLMFGGGRHLAFNHGEQCWDDDFVDKRVEKYLRTLPERLDLVSDTDTGTGENDSTAQQSSLDLAASWTGIIGHSADGHPWVGEVPDRPGIFLCGGYSGHGMTNAPLCGRYIARLALEDLGARLGGDDAARSLIRHGSEDVMMSEVNVDVPAEYLISRERMETLSRGN